jgi:dihydrofolate reductase
MRRLIESTLLALDGVIGEPRVWASDYFDAEAQEKALDQLMASDAMLMGRHTYEIFSQTWPSISGPYSDRINGIRKYVFSSTLRDTDWNNSTIVRGDVAAEVTKLKQQDGQDLVMYGHGPLGETLLEHDLLDELQFAVHPLLVGSGALLFREGQKKTLKLVETKTLQTGVVFLTYQPATT